MHLVKVAQNTKNFQQPDNHYDCHDYVQDILDFSIHRNITVHQPEDNTGYKKNKKNREQGHAKFFEEGYR